MNRKEKQIKIEEREDRLDLTSRWLKPNFVKIEFDPQQFPPVKWAPIRPQSEAADISVNDPPSEASPNVKWVKTMKRILSKMLSVYISEKDFSNFVQKFKKWRHSSTFIFAILMYVHHRLPKQKNHFCDSYKSKIEAYSQQNFPENDLAALRWSTNIVLEFFIGEPFLAIEQFYQKYGSRPNYDPLKAKKFIKTLEKAIMEDEVWEKLEYEFTSADFYENQDGGRVEESIKLAEDESVKDSSSDINAIENQQQMKEAKQVREVRRDESSRNKKGGSDDLFLIYRKGDASKSALYPIDLNFTIKNAFNDLFPL